MLRPEQGRCGHRLGFLSAYHAMRGLTQGSTNREPVMQLISGDSSGHGLVLTRD